MIQFFQSLFRWEPKPAEHVEILLSDESIGVRNLAQNATTELRWNEIDRITIVTTDQGPFFEDVFFAFEGRGIAIIVTHEDAVRLDLYEAIVAHLTGIDHEQAIAAMKCTDNNSFIMFERQHALDR